ncbi:XisI protein [[Leptolyngbya] sp. PCC 7376]|uniref:XisI protein n=1 Tax=[Leptolyngbya] sp. PCC 7376 TaxID=111781 RepID=UPI00029F4B90|nr:element excision factor XisI family protein [[Leptolyngbya] sp. PCC 7376]AFY39941.1 XisI protein [[Leptolyngbya] sp. PCC 7376]
MDNLKQLKQAAIQVLQDYYDFLGQDPDSELQLIIDENNNHYLLLETGWYKNQRIYGSLIHIDLLKGKIWIQNDSTEEGIANELVKLGIPPEQIVLAFKSIERRKITDFAVA